MSLENLRNEINKMDDEIRDLLIKRLSLVEEVAKVKMVEGRPVLDAGREREVVSRLTKDLDEAMAGYVKVLFTTIFDISRTHQTIAINKESKTVTKIKDALKDTPQLFPKSAVVACQGTEGANSMFACEKLFSRPSILYFDTFDSVFNAVDKGLCTYGILPIENSLHGSVTSAYDLMKKYKFHIIRSIKIKISHALLAKPGTDLSQIKTVYSHEQALAQCSEFLKDLNVKIQPCENTAMAAKLVSESENNEIAAISSTYCAELYNLKIMDDKIENSDNNYTKFICISKKLEIYPGSRRISLMMTIPHRPGALYHLMAKFAALGINLTKLESRPMPDKDFEFMFYFDLDISVYDEAVFNLFSQLEEGTEKFEFLGCYSEM